LAISNSLTPVNLFLTMLLFFFHIAIPGYFQSLTSVNLFLTILLFFFHTAIPGYFQSLTSVNLFLTILLFFFHIAIPGYFQSFDICQSIFNNALVLLSHCHSWLVTAVRKLIPSKFAPNSLFLLWKGQNTYINPLTLGQTGQDTGSFPLSPLPSSTYPPARD
jgi:hypothetical protein